MKKRGWFRLVVCLLLMLTTKFSYSAEELRLVKAVQTVSTPDTAFLNIEAPPDAEIYIGTENYKDQRKFEMGSLKDGHFYDYQIQIKRRQRVIAEKTVQLKAGLNVVLKLVPVDPKPLKLKADTKKFPEFAFGNHMAFSPDGKYLASDSVVLDLEKMLAVRHFRHNYFADSLTRIEFENGSEAIRLFPSFYRPDLKRTVSRSVAYQLRTEEFNDFREVPAIREFSDDNGNDYCRWNVRGRRVFVQMRNPPYHSAEFTLPDGLLNTIQTCIPLREKNSGKKLEKLEHLLKTIIADVSFSTDGNWLALGIFKPRFLDSDPGAPLIPCCIIWDLKQDRLYEEYYDFRTEQRIFSNSRTKVKFSPDSKTLAIGNRELLLFSMSQQKVTNRLGITGDSLGLIALPEDPFSDTVLMSAGSWSGVWSRKTGGLTNLLPVKKENGSIVNLTLSGDGNVAHTEIFQTFPFKNEDTFWNTKTGLIISKESDGHSSLKFNYDGSRYLHKGNNGVSFLNATVGSQTLHQYPESTYPYFHKNGVIYVAKTKTFPQQMKDYYSEIISVSADGSRCAVKQEAGEDGQSHHWQVYRLPSKQLLSSKAVTSNLSAADTSLSNVKLSPFGHFLAVVEEPFEEGISQRLTVYNVDKETIVISVPDLHDMIHPLAFNGDETLFFVGYYDGVIEIYSTVTGDLIASVTLMEEEREWLVSTPDGLFDGTAGARNQICYQFDGELTTIPVDRFFNDYYYPGLFAIILAGEVPRSEIHARELPPRIQIVSPKQGGEFTTDQVVIEVELTDQGGGISGPWLRQNGAKVKSTGKRKGTGKKVRYTFPISLVEGENRIRVEAASRDARLESEPARISFNYSQAIDKPDLYIVAIGINKYASQSMNLNFSVNDAQAISKLFRQRGNLLYNEVHIKELVDEQATRQKIREAFHDFAKQAKPQDTLLVYLSGHGKAIGQRYYFLPHEFKIRSAKFVDDIRDYGYPIDELSEAMADVKALKRVLILDTCHSGAAIVKSGNRSRNPFGFRGAIERLSRAQGIFTIAAAPASEETVENAELKHGILTYSLLAGLKSVAVGPLSDQHIKTNNNSQIVDVLEWFSYANERVPELTQKYRGRPQDVQMSTNGTSFPILPLK